MKVVKIGGGCLKDGKAARTIIRLIAARGKGDVFVVSAFYGVTNILLSGIEASLECEESIGKTVKKLKAMHHEIIHLLITDDTKKDELTGEMDLVLHKLERYYFGISFTREATPRMRDMVATFGERMSALILSGAVELMGQNAAMALPEELGIITDGKYMDATALMDQTGRNLKTFKDKEMTRDRILFVPGFYGISETGEVTTFGRGGSDYSAAVVAAGMEADVLEIWKDTPGFMTADPDNVPHCRLIPRLTYEEAAELAYTGAGILHPRTVEPVRASGIDIAIKNTYDPDAEGSLITGDAIETDTIIKSVSYTKDVSLLKIRASGVGARQGILSLITEAVSGQGINIKSVITSQTCISLLLSRKDIGRAHECVQNIRPIPFRESSSRADVALVSIVGEGLHLNRGIAAKCFTAVSRANVNVEMISSGTSDAALYFLVRENSLNDTVQALHAIFFD